MRTGPFYGLAYSHAKPINENRGRSGFAPPLYRERHDAATDRNRRREIMNNDKRGLVLSGGGAKGAYQAGIVKALAELDIKIDAVSGTSIGALNGAVLSASSSVPDAAVRLQKLWHTLAEEPPLENEVPAPVRLLESAGLKLKPVVRNTTILAKEIQQNLISTLRSPEKGYLVDNGPIQKLLNEYVTHERLAAGLPLYVSIFPNRSVWESVIGYSLAVAGIKDTPKSEFFLVQSLSAEDQRKVLLASAAIPFLLEAQEINGERYSDGGLGGRINSQGNTPIQPLVEEGYKTIIVTSLSDRMAWEGQKYPGTTLLEIRREKPIDRTPILPEVLDVVSFHPSKIYSWIEQGYQDTIRSLTPHLPLLSGQGQLDSNT